MHRLQSCKFLQSTLKTRACYVKINIYFGIVVVFLFFCFTKTTVYRILFPVNLWKYAKMYFLKVRARPGIACGHSKFRLSESYPVLGFWLQLCSWVPPPLLPILSGVWMRIFEKNSFPYFVSPNLKYQIHIRFFPENNGFQLS